MSRTISMDLDRRSNRFINAMTSFLSKITLCRPLDPLQLSLENRIFKEVAMPALHSRVEIAVPMPDICMSWSYPACCLVKISDS